MKIMNFFMISLLATSVVVTLSASEEALLKVEDAAASTPLVQKTLTEQELSKRLEEQKVEFSKQRSMATNKKIELVKAQTATLAAQKESDTMHTPYQAKQAELDALRKQRDDKKAQQKEFEKAAKKLGTEAREISIKVTIQNKETVAARRLYNEAKLKTGTIEQQEKAAQKELEEARKQLHAAGINANETIAEINKTKTGSWTSAFTFGFSKDAALDPLEEVYRPTSPDQLALFTPKK
jgi:chromosome segregation ATPase